MKLYLSSATWTVVFGILGAATAAENDDSHHSSLRNGRNLYGDGCKGTSRSVSWPDRGCDSDYPICVFDTGIEVPRGHWTGDKCAKCKRTTVHRGVDEGCTDDEPHCVGSSGEELSANEAGMECSATNPAGGDSGTVGGGSGGCTNTRVDRLEDNGCWPGVPFCVERDGDETPLWEEGDHCEWCPLATGWPAKQFLALSDQELWDSATNGNIIGKYCKIDDERDTPGAACNWYAKGRPGLNGDGVPRTGNDDGGTGCIDEDGPDFCYIIDHDSKMNYMDDDPLTDRSSMCTDDVVHNGAEQLRWALNNGYCDDFCEDRNIVFPDHY